MFDSGQPKHVQAGAIAAPLVVGITSHRNLVASELDLLRQRVRGVFEDFRSAFPHSPLVVLSSLAAGGDQLVAQVGLDCGADLIAPLPFARELYARDFADAASREHFDALCTRAHLIELPLLPAHTVEQVRNDGVERNRQYANAGMFVARHCHLLLAIWDGKPSSHLGGTAQIVRYYLNGELPGELDRRRAHHPQLYAGDDERLLCHIACSRAVADGAPAPPLQPGQVRWCNQGGNSAPDLPMPATFRAVFANADDFNADALKYRQQVADSAGGIADEPPPGADAGVRASPAALFRAADWLAIHFQQRVHLAMRVIYLIAFVMGLAFTLYDNLPDQDHMLYVFLLLFASGVLISGIARRRAWHRKYLDYRALAEGLRVQYYWRRAGISLTSDPEFARDSLMQKQDIELGWVRNVMRGAGLAAGAHAARTDAAAMQQVIREWVGDETDGELGYYRRSTRQREHAHRVNEAIGTICLAVGIFISVLLSVLMHWLTPGLKNDLIVVMAVFSIFAAVREAYSFRKADRELIRQYRFMERVFANARARLGAGDDLDEQREILRVLGETALSEHVEWAVMHRERPLEAGKM